MINNAKSLPLWVRIIGAIVVLMVLLSIRMGVKTAMTSLESVNTVPEDYFSAHGDVMVKIDSDLKNMATDLEKVGQGDRSVMGDFGINSEALNKDVMELQGYDGDVPSQYAKADQTLTKALDDLLLIGDKIQDDVENNNGTLLSIHMNRLIEGRTLLKQAADEMIEVHNNQL